MKLPLCSAVLLTLLSLSGLPAALIVEESFDALAGSAFPDFTAPVPPATQPASGEGSGLVPPPKATATTTPLTITEAGLAYEDDRGKRLATKGRAAALPEGDSVFFNLYESDSSDPFAKLRNPADARELGRDGEVIWLSFLLRAEEEPAATDKFVLRFTGSKTSFPIGVLNRPSSGEPMIVAISVSSKVAIEAGKTYFLVLRATLGENGSTDLWINPTLGGEEPGGEAAIHFDKTPVFLRSISFRKTTENSLPVVVDELRIGETWADVAPAP